MNIDGAMLSNGSKGGIGGIVCNCFGACLGTFSLSIGSGPPIMAELEAINHGLDFFFSRGKFVSSRLILESDSVIVIDWISNPSLCPLIFEALVASCRKIIEVNSVISDSFLDILTH
ncbi:hypothetical protein V6N11_012371 [Hibiscus sabdariffa]|uniref:Uncharacterized protein n=2 Tax=Hibiscus sabdariffa TaxID=183260 RepID=A0ABR2AX37_9ROSI